MEPGPPTFLYPPPHEAAFFHQPPSVATVGGLVVPPRRRDSLPDHYLSYRENRQVEFDSAAGALPLNLTDRRRNYSDGGEHPAEAVKEEEGAGMAPNAPQMGVSNEVLAERNEGNSSRTVIGNYCCCLTHVRIMPRMSQCAVILNQYNPNLQNCFMILDSYTIYILNASYLGNMCKFLLAPVCKYGRPNIQQIRCNQRNLNDREGQQAYTFNHLVNTLAL